MANFWEMALDTVKNGIDCMTGCTSEVYICDLAHLATEDENYTGAWIIGTYNAVEFIAENYDIAREVYDEYAYSLGEELNPLKDPEAFTFYMLYYAAEQLIAENEYIRELERDNDTIVITQDIADAINAAF